MGLKGRTVRIGGAGGFLGDSSVAAPQLLAGGKLDYMILDYLAEGTMGMLGRGLAANPESGYARDFTDWVWKDNLLEFRRQGVRVVTNAGGMNPHECRRRMEEIARRAGASFKIAVIDGDDVRGRLEALRTQGVTEMFSSAALPDPDQVLSANAYFGAGPIAEALAAGAEVVITGRVVDSALTLGPLIHEFGWSLDDYDRLSAGSLAGHVIECGAQATGGLFTDWDSVPDWAHIGYPVVECDETGAFEVCKPPGTGGLVTPATVAEQILYEVGDPAAYLLPDVACDFTHVTVAASGPDRVIVEGAKGRSPTGRYKVCLTHADGWRAIAVMPVVGRDADAKALRQSEAVLERVGEMLRDRNLAPFRAHRTEIVGAESSYGAQARALRPREVIAKVGVEHDDRRAIDLFLREFNAPMTSMSVGSTGWFAGRPEAAPVVRVFSFDLPRADVPAHVSFGGRTWTAAPSPVSSPASAPDARAHGAPPPDTREDLVEAPLIDLAWARSGDKGDAFNVGVIARRADLLPWIRAALTEEAVLRFFAHEFEGGKAPKVIRYEVPGLCALNFHCLDALGGGQFASLRLDPLAKGKGQQLLEFPVRVPRSLVPGGDRAGA